MLAKSYASQNTSPACYQRHAERMPAFQSMPAMCMGMAAATSATSMTIIGTGANTPVFLFVVLFLGSLLLVNLVALISLLLTGLTGLLSLESLVGHSVVRLSQGKT